MSDEGFLSRWSRRKAAVKAGVAPPAEPMPTAVAPTLPEPVVEAPAAAAAPQTTQPPPAPPAPTLADVAQLTQSSDYSRFVAPQVDDAVKRAALKKLFSDPHFNVMDGLDTYIDDYSQPDPIPLAMLKRMTQSHALGLFAEEQQPSSPKASPDGAAEPPLSQSTQEPEAVPPDEDPDLRLQQDDAAGPGGPDEGPPA